MMAPQMLVGTNFGIGIRDPEWFEHRLGLFSSVTAPSLLAQEDQSFHWALFVDSALPAGVRERLEAILAPFEGRAFVHTDPHVAGPDMLELARRRGIMDGDEGLLTGRIDDDDAWHVGTVGAVRNRVAAWRRRESGAPGVGLTFEDGLVWVMYEMVDIKKTYSSGRRVNLTPTLRPFSFRFLSMSVFVYSQPAHPRVAMSMAHSRSEATLRSDGLDVEAISTEQPMWLYCRHKQTSSGTAYSSAEPEERTLAELSRAFGLDEIKISTYLADSENYGYSLVKDSMAWQMGLAKRLDRIRSEIASASGDDAELARLRGKEAELSEQLEQLSDCLTGDPDEILIAQKPHPDHGAA